MKSSPLRYAAWLPILLGLLLGQIARAVPGYDAQLRIVPDSTPYGPYQSQINNDGAFAYSYYDGATQSWIGGVWVPRPLYGHPAGFTPLVQGLVPGPYGATALYPRIDNAGTFTYYTGSGGNTFGSDAGPISPTTIPGWSEQTASSFFPLYGIGGWASSDPSPYTAFGATVSFREGNIYQPTFSYDYSGTVVGSLLQFMTRPSGDFGEITQLNRLGHQIWIVSDARTDLPGRVRGNSQRYYAVTPAGTMEIGAGYFMSGRGDVSFHTSATAPSGLSPGTAYLLLAGPLGPLGPGLHRQSDIPGMPEGHFIRLFNSAGVMVVAKGLEPPRLLNGGKSALLDRLLPSLVPSPQLLNSGNVTGINEAGMLGWIARQNNGGGPQFLLTPTVDCDVALTGTQPYRIGEEFDLEVMVRNVAGTAVTNVRVEGGTPGSSGISVTSFPRFDILSGPVPVTPLTLTAGGTQVIRYHCKAKNSGVGEVKAMVKCTAASGNALRCEATTSIEIELRGDLLVKRTDEPSGAFALDNVYQKTAPTGAQDRQEQFAGDGETISFDVKVQNDELGPLKLLVSSLDTGSTSIPARYFQGATELTSLTTTGWTTPTLAAGASVTLRVEFGPGEGSLAGDFRSSLLTLQPEDGGATCDRVRVKTVYAPAVAVVLRRPEAFGLYPQSILAGKGDLNAPLMFTDDTASLHGQARVTRGLIADGVTPLLLEMEADPLELAALPGGVTYNVSLEPVAGGILRRLPVAQRLRILKDGLWQPAGPLTFTQSQYRHFACITPVDPDDLQLITSKTELELELTFRRPDTNAYVAGKKILLRRPPVALVHGYNTNGDWGPAFSNRLAASRGADFVKTIRYGQEPQGVADTSRETTVLPFSQLVPILESQYEALRTEIRASGWAMTRFDVVAHSQGGVLTRMLCSQNANGFLELPFRSPANFYRGRFHRVVTVGSPHNGTRLVSFMQRAAALLSLDPAQLGVARAISEIMIFSGNSQPKFDPFGPAIRELNSPNPSAPWYPDSGAMFHLIATSVDNGMSPNFGVGSPSELALGLASSYGPLVLPHGSDGVVDRDSMTGTTPEAGQSVPLNSYTMPEDLNISHALVIVEGINIFGGNDGQVDSAPVGTHTIGALDQDPAMPAAERVFGSFRLPIPLPPSVASDLDSAAANVSFLPGAIGFAVDLAGRNVSISCQFSVPDGEVLAGPVTWTVERYGVNGLTSEGVTLQPSEDPARVGVDIDPDMWGDVVLYGTAITATGQAIIGEPFVVASYRPDPLTWTLDEIEIESDGGSYPVGAGIEPVLWEIWLSEDMSETLRIRRFLRAGDLTVVSTPSYVMNVSAPLLWKAEYPGNVDITVTVQGVSTFLQFTVYPQTSAGLDSDGDGLGDRLESQVPSRIGNGKGDGNGDGLQDNSQLTVASLHGPADRWLTLLSPSGTYFFEVTTVPTPIDPLLPDNPAALPEATAFDFGFLQCNLYNVPAGGSTIITILLPANHEVTTLWAWGEEPGLAGPHWFEFLDDGQSGGVIQADRILLRVKDGGPGDLDGAANGLIHIGPIGLARVIPGPPGLHISAAGGTPALLTWPATFPNHARTLLETSDDLLNWYFVPEIPLTNAGQNTLSVPPDALRGYFRLHGY